MAKSAWWSGSVLFALLVAGCGGSSGPATGSERGPCYGNGSCNTGLECLSNTCVKPAASGAAGTSGTAGKGGAGGTGGSAATGGTTATAGTGGSGAGTGGGAGAGGSAGGTGGAASGTGGTAGAGTPGTGGTAGTVGTGGTGGSIGGRGGSGGSTGGAGGTGGSTGGGGGSAGGTGGSTGGTGGSTGGTGGSSAAPTCNAYCNAITDKCTGALQQQYTLLTTCLAACPAFPVGTTADINGDTLGCRYHRLLIGDPCVQAGPSGGPSCGGDPCAPYCDLVLAACTAANSQYASRSACMTACASFNANSDAYNTSASGNTDQGINCYLAFAVLASANPDTHCKHVVMNPSNTVCHN